MSAQVEENGIEGDEEHGDSQEQPPVVIDDATRESCIIDVQRVCKGHMARRRYTAVSSGLVHPDPKAWKTLQMLSGGVGLGPINIHLETGWKADLMPINNMRIVNKIGVVRSYYGDLDAGKRWHGKGKAEFWSGAKYTGDFIHGNMHGKGEYIWEDGCVYTGAVEHNELTGQGRIDWSSGDWYVGSIQAGLRHGRGKFVKVKDDGECEVQVSYEGDWVHGERHGKGKLVIEQSGEWYNGDWRNGERLDAVSGADLRSSHAETRNGHGTMQYRSGNVYAGQWKDGRREGDGRMQWLDVNELYVGEWARGMQHGAGTHFWLPADGDMASRNLPSLNYYHGEWRDGLRSGFGQFNYADGSSYKGEWVDNYKHGEGSYTSAQGFKTTGVFDKGHLVAPGPNQSGVPTKPGSMQPESEHPAVSSHALAVQCPVLTSVARYIRATDDATLQIDDLVSWAENGERQVTQVKKVLLSYISELKVIFQAYSRSELFAEAEPLPPPPAGSSSARTLLPRNPLASEFKDRQTKQLQMLAEFGGKTMPMSRFLQFARDCKLQDGNLPLVAIERTVAAVQHGTSRSFGHLIDGEDDGSSNGTKPMPMTLTTTTTMPNGAGRRRLLFSEFLEVLVRLADVKYEEIGALPARLSFCLYRNVFPNVNMQRSIASETDADLQFATADSFFSDVFLKCLHASEAAEVPGTEEEDDGVALVPTLRGVLQIVEEFGMIDAKCSIAKTLHLFASTLFPSPEDATANLGNLEVPVTFPEFVSVMRALAAIRFEAVASDSVLPSLKHAIQLRAEGVQQLAQAEVMARDASSEEEIKATEAVLVKADKTIKETFPLGRGKAKEEKARSAKVRGVLEACRAAMRAAAAAAEAAAAEEAGDEEEAS